jgi:23S rRNA (uracil1939-C5)-methyltransferase
MALVGERVSLDLVDLASDGRGVGRLEGQVVFVAGGLPGDRVRARIVARSRRHLVAELLAVETASIDRRRPPCILADHCGGCSLQPLEDTAQQAWKQKQVEENLRRIAGLEPDVSPLLASASGLGYRNRAVIPLERDPDGRLRAGYYRRGSHQIVNMNRCPVLDPRIDELILPLKEDLEAAPWPVDRHGHGGGLRHLALRVGSRSGERLITLVSSSADLEGLEPLVEAWMARWPDLVGVALNLQPLANNLLMGSETRVLAGRGWIREQFAGLELRIAADTFFQVHTEQAERVVPLLLAFLAGVPGRLVDAFCGIGTYSLPLAAAGWQVHGLEQHGGAVELARFNAAANGLSERTCFEVAEVGALLAERLPGVQALFVDPPRKGLEPAALAAVLADPPPRLAYLSCDPATLARDLGQLTGEGGYRLVGVHPIDFFPNTSHVETLACLERP